MKSRNSSKSEEGELYCVCRSADTGRFMIGCDHCGDWFHGDCVNVTANKAKTIKKFYCPLCREVNPALQILFGVRDEKNDNLKRSHKKKEKPGRGRPPDKKKKTKTTEKAPPTKKYRTESPSLSVRGVNIRCGQCIGCFKKDDCGRCDQCKTRRTTNELCQMRRCVNAALLDKKAKPSQKPKVKHISRQGPGGDKSSRDVTLSGGTRATSKKYEEFLKDAGILSSDDETFLQGIQCLNPPCVNVARKQSKYCCDDCGLAMAKKRIETILPERLKEWKRVTPVAESKQKQQLEQTYLMHNQARERLHDLDEKEEYLNAWITKAETFKDDLDSSDESDEDGDDVNMYCVTCGQETSVKGALKHLARCFAKYESQVSYGTVSKMSNPYNMFCDTFNKSNGTYCRRLRALCPEHTKEKKGDDAQICGYPLNWNWVKLPDVSSMSVSTICVRPKRRCVRHVQWDRKCKAVIDCERLAAMLTMEEVIEKERALRVAIASRGGVLALMLHSTIDHTNEKKEIVES